MKTSRLKKIPAAKAKGAAVRVGRPPKELAGEVDARILDAARKLFLERGFEGASIDDRGGSSLGKADDLRPLPRQTGAVHRSGDTGHPFAHHRVQD
jgi:hypothetical protein